MAYKVTIYENRWAAIIQTGDGNRWLKSKADTIKHRAIIIAPRRTGRLAASHRTVQERSRRGRFQSGWRVEAAAPYAAYVHQGTGIHGPGGRGMIIRRMSIPAYGHGPGFFGSGRRVIRRSRGQRSQPWLEQAARQVI
ncbi:hypothetical protein PBI_HYPERION_32 [Microbacterium phage Hyperion]|uniref:Uncharacterized protein n=1 Tax=Microbacterium phage Hyperion TaxID=2182354 RepID=A0A2U8UIQ6_9CAUD|nr:hypothetical protein HOT27_gp032 [Microbacterium phage Hyperion]AWN03549.1 hypothetical protein PBI_HYPERION_32 [Microbacterium phage Hyperion]